MTPVQKPQRPAQPAKPALQPGVIQSAMDRRPRLNANQRRANPGVPAKPPATAPPAEPAWMALRRAGQAGTGSAAGNRAAAGALPSGAVASKPLPPPAPGGEEPFLVASKPAAGPGPLSYGADGVMHELPGAVGGGAMGADPRISAPLPPPGGGFDGTDLRSGAGTEGGAPAGYGTGPLDPSMSTDSSGPPPGSQNPLFSANLPPAIMQRLQALRAGRGAAGAVGGQGAPGAQPPGAPAAMPPPTLPDYYQPPAARGAGAGFARRTGY